MKILFLADSPTVETGFGRVGRGIVRELLKDGHSIHYVGINEEGKHHECRTWKNLTITNANQGGDFFGRIQTLRELKQDFDLLFVIHDLKTLTMPLGGKYSFLQLFQELNRVKKTPTKMLLYFPIDYKIIGDKKHLNTYDILKTVDYLVPYTYFAKNQLNKLGIETEEPIYHGWEEKEWGTVSRQRRKEVRTELMGEKAKTHKLILINARNQWRKDIASSIEAFAKLKEKIPAFLYLNSSIKDMGGDLKEYLDMWGLVEGEDWVSRKADEKYGIPQERLNEIYHCADMGLSTAWGEGFGLMYLEAMACGVPIITSSCSVEEELLPQEYLVQATNRIYCPAGQDATPYPRYVSNPDEIANAMIDWFLKPQKEQEKVIREAKKTVGEWKYDVIGAKWREMVAKI